MGILTEIGRIGLKIYFHTRFKFEFKYTDFNPNRKDPYVLIFNHAQLNDPLYIGMNLKYFPYPIASNLLYTNTWMRLGLTKVVKSIPKRKGQSDSRTIRQILQAFNKDKRGIMVAPEGNSSFFGEQTETDYISTAKLVKKLDHDLVIAKINGGYLAAPRWGKARKKAIIEVEYKRLAKAGEYNKYSIEELAKLMEENIQFNEYQWIENKKYAYKQDNKAEGLEYYLYACPKCHAIQTISTDHDEIYCKKCGHVAHMNEVQLLEGLEFKTLIEWGQKQKELLKNHVNETFESEGDLYDIDFTKNKRHLLGTVNVRLQNRQLEIKNRKLHQTFDVEHIEGLTLTQKNKISFDYGDKTFLIKLRDPMLFFDLINYLKGANL